MTLAIGQDPRNQILLTYFNPEELNSVTRICGDTMVGYVTNNCAFPELLKCHYLLKQQGAHKLDAGTRSSEIKNFYLVQDFIKATGYPCLWAWECGRGFAACKYIN